MASNLEYIYTLKDKYSKQLALISKKQKDFSHIYLKSMGKMNSAVIKHREILTQSKMAHTQYANTVIKNNNRMTSSSRKQSQAIQKQRQIRQKQATEAKRAHGKSGGKTKGDKMGMLAGGVGGGFFLKGALDTTVAFQTNLNAIKSVDATVDIDLMSKKAMEWGRKTKFSAVQVSGAMREASQAGMKQQEILTSMPGNIALAASGQMTLVDAMMLSTDVVNQFGKEVSNQDWADILAKGAANSTSRVSQLGAALRNTGTQAYQAGIKSKDLMVGLMGLGETGLRGEAGGTYMNNMLARMSMMGGGKGGSKLQKGMGSFLSGTGFKLSDIYDIDKGQFKDFNKFMDLLATADVAKVSKLKGAFGMQGGKAIGALAQLNPQQLLKFRMEMIETDGAAMKMAATLMEGLPGAMVRLDSAWETTKIVMMAGFVPAMASVIEVMSNFLAHLQQDHPWILQIAFGIIALTTAFVAIGTALWLVTTAWGAWTVALSLSNIAMLWGLLKTGLYVIAIGLLAAVVLTAITVWGLWTVAQWAMNLAMWACPITWIVAAILGLVAGIVLAIVYFDEITEAILEWAFALTKWLSPALQIATDAVAWLFDKLSLLPSWLGGDMFAEAADSARNFKKTLDGINDADNVHSYMGKLSIKESDVIAKLKEAGDYDALVERGMTDRNIVDAAKEMYFEAGSPMNANWVDDMTRESVDERNSVMQNQQKVDVSGDIKVSADQNSKVDYQNFDFNTGAN